jgi:hypothetical protein
MSNPSKTPIGQQIAALKRLHRLHEVNPKMLAKFATQADRDYVMHGIAAAISTLEFVHANTAALRRGIEAERADRIAKDLAAAGVRSVSQ